MAKGKVLTAILGFLAVSLLYGEQINYYYGKLVDFLQQNGNWLLIELETRMINGIPLFLVLLGSVIAFCLVALIYLAVKEQEYTPFT